MKTGSTEASVEAPWNQLPWKLSWKLPRKLLPWKLPRTFLWKRPAEKFPWKLPCFHAGFLHFYRSFHGLPRKKQTVQETG